MLPTLQFPELFIGICSPVGVPNAKLTDILRSVFLSYDYQVKDFKVTDLMKMIGVPNLELDETTVQSRYDTYINYANQLRLLTDDASVLSVLCCIAARNFRKSKTGERDSYAPKQAYVFDQFKRPEEIELLRQIYGRAFILIGIHSDKEVRLKTLTDKIASKTGSSRSGDQDEFEARKLITRDQKEPNVVYGQRLSDTFALSDLFISIDNIQDAERNVKRFLDGLFGANNVSPTRSEYGMYLAKTASLRSTDLSRQVGAAICTSEGEVITLGSNEVPKAGGGTYWAIDSHDARDHVLGRDENERVKRSLMVDLIKRLKKADILKDDIDEGKIHEFVLAQTTTKGSELRDSQIMDLLEFGRIIHAEMSAICDAARTGKSLKSMILYATTFPCHICAKHIVASGISRVFYIEPYEKSYAVQLHGDSIQTSPYQDGCDKVSFEPFIGVSPVRYRDIFERGKRKTEDGSYNHWRDGEPKANVKFTFATYLSNEEAVIHTFKVKIIQLAEENKVQILALDKIA
jgi:deoxycytidylate deaminase